MGQGFHALCVNFRDQIFPVPVRFDRNLDVAENVLEHYDVFGCFPVAAESIMLSSLGWIRHCGRVLGTAHRPLWHWRLTPPRDKGGVVEKHRLAGLGRQLAGVKS